MGGSIPLSAVRRKTAVRPFCGAPFAALTLLFLAMTPLAHATPLLYTLNLDNCTGTCGTPPFGTVALDQVDPLTVLVSLTLNPGEGLVQTGAGKALLFDIAGNPLINISNLTPGFVVLSTGLSAAGLGSFEYGVDCGTACGPGASKTFTGVLSFDVTRSDATNLFTTDFAANGSGIFFATDIIGANGNTGPVGSNQHCTGGPGCGGDPTVNPEPASLALVGMGLIGVFFLRRRRA